MIIVSGNAVEYEEISSTYPSGSVERRTLRILSQSRNTYRYESMNQLKFELELRSNIVNASRDLLRSRMAFRTFRESKCNEEFWTRTEEGGFLLKRGIKPSEAIRDIFIHGREYGTECATAMVIVFLKAVLELYPEELFNRLFDRLYLMNWAHLDNDLGIHTYRDIADSLPGDCRYFRNPDVDPMTPEWQGENTIDLGNETYYGHGMGIAPADIIIAALNRRRVPGSTTSAYLMDSATRPDFENLWRKYPAFAPEPELATYEAL